MKPPEIGAALGIGPPRRYGKNLAYATQWAPRFNPPLPFQRSVMMMKTESLVATAEGIARAAAILRSGGLVAMPTETVYGLAGDARSDHAVARIFDAKNRPHFNPLIVHLPDIASARQIAQFDDRALALAAAYWPGPLTLVLPLREDANLSPLVTAGLTSVAIRLPAHPVARALLLAFGGPVAAPSANPSGRVSPTRASHVRDGLSGRIEAILDGGPCTVGVESTILGLSGGPTTLLRPGGISVEALEATLGHPLQSSPTTTAKITAPGQLASHYAPVAPVRLNVTIPDPTEVYIGFGPTPHQTALTLSATADLIEAAANLFHTLREADQIAGKNPIAFAPIPNHGLGRAINDRLTRAAAPRS